MCCAADKAQRIFDVILVVLVLYLILHFYRFHKDGVQNWWRRRVAAARYKKMKKHDTEEGESVELEPTVEGHLSGPEDEPTFMETLKLTLTRDKTVPCTIDLGGNAFKPQTIDANVGKLEKVSELPFFLQEACRSSGHGELAALSLVDLWLKERAVIELIQPDGRTKAAGKGCTPSEARRAKGFKVTILPQSTR